MRVRLIVSAAASLALLQGVPQCRAEQFERLDRRPEQKTSAPAKNPQNGQATSKNKLEKLTVEQILERLPRRVASKPGTEGDMVNFLLVGSKEQMIAALTAAGWVQVDRDTQEAVVHAIMSTIENKGYTEMPMSTLYLFRRPQDYGFAHALPLAVATERHHFRIWKAPWQTTDGQAVWVGAGTHDIGIERGSDGNLTHRIDPEVDKEREYIAESLQDAEKIKDSRHLNPKEPVLEAVTATGAAYRSDGRVLVIFLK